MNPLTYTTYLLAIASHTVIAQPQPPFIEHQVYESQHRCFNIAVETMNHSPFRVTNAYGINDEVFGTYQQYKASIKCINLEDKKQLAIFSVAGVSNTNKYALMMVENLKKSFIGEEEKDSD